MIKGDKRIALRIINGAINLIKVGWTQGSARVYDHDTDTTRYCMIGACRQVEDDLRSKTSYFQRDKFERASDRARSELNRLARARGFCDMVGFNDSPTTTSAAVVRLMNRAKKNIEKGADARASARSSK